MALEENVRRADERAEEIRSIRERIAKEIAGLWEDGAAEKSWIGQSLERKLKAESEKLSSS